MKRNIKNYVFAKNNFLNNFRQYTNMRLCSNSLNSNIPIQR